MMSEKKIQSRAFFITGTDTGVGKTLVSAALLVKAQQNQLTTAALKPVAAGCEETADGLRNDDALLLQKYCQPALSYEQINPIALREAIAPHLAAAHENRRLSVNGLSGFCRGVLSARANFTVVEGAGGWRVPLNARETLADLAKELHLPVILVVGVRLGCINHTLLTVEAIVRDGLPLAAWVANVVDADQDPALVDEIIATIGDRLLAPCLGKIPCLNNALPELAAEYLDLSPLM
jgi:dethiobiotin synthetase